MQPRSVPRPRGNRQVQAGPLRPGRPLRPSRRTKGGFRTPLKIHDLPTTPTSRVETGYASTQSVRCLSVKVALDHCAFWMFVRVTSARSNSSLGTMWRLGSNANCSSYTCAASLTRATRHCSTRQAPTLPSALHLNQRFLAQTGQALPWREHEHAFVTLDLQQPIYDYPLPHD